MLVWGSGSGFPLGLCWQSLGEGLHATADWGQEFGTAPHRPLQVPCTGRAQVAVLTSMGLLCWNPSVSPRGGLSPASRVVSTLYVGVCFSVVFDWSRGVVCFYCPFHLWLEIAGFWGPALFAPIGVSGSLASLATSVSMGQRRPRKSPLSWSSGPGVPSQSAASPLSIFMFLSNIKSSYSSSA